MLIDALATNASNPKKKKKKEGKTPRQDVNTTKPIRNPQV